VHRLQGALEASVEEDMSAASSSLLGLLNNDREEYVDWRLKLNSSQE